MKKMSLLKNFCVIVKKEKISSYKSFVRINREIGANPMRSRHCDKGLILKPLDIYLGR